LFLQTQIEDGKIDVRLVLMSVRINAVIPDVLNGSGMYVCLCVCTFVRVRVDVCTCVSMRVRQCAFVDVCMSIHVLVAEFLYVWVFKHV